MVLGTVSTTSASMPLPPSLGATAAAGAAAPPPAGPVAAVTAAAAAAAGGGGAAAAAIHSFTATTPTSSLARSSDKGLCRSKT